MDPDAEHGGRRGLYFAAAVTALLTALGATLVLLGVTASDGPQVAAAGDGRGAASSPAAGESRPGQSREHQSGKPADDSTADFGTFLPGSRPVGLSIPSIGVSSTRIVDLGLQDDGSIEVPSDASTPGWFSPGPSPGQLGPAVIAGHVDSETGPAVFYELGQLRPGDRAQITRADGTVATFRIDRVETFEKDDFPTRSVYGATTRAELRLITCSGRYAEDTGYDSNTVVFAHLI